jgi:hypothetical protein
MFVNVTSSISERSGIGRKLHNFLFRIKARVLKLSGDDSHERVKVMHI